MTSSYDRLTEMTIVLLKEFGAGTFTLNLARKQIKNHVNEQKAKQILEYLHKKTEPPY